MGQFALIIFCAVVAGVIAIPEPAVVWHSPGGSIYINITRASELLAEFRSMQPAPPAPQSFRVCYIGNSPHDWPY